MNTRLRQRRKAILRHFAKPLREANKHKDSGKRGLARLLVYSRLDHALDFCYTKERNSKEFLIFCSEVLSFVAWRKRKIIKFDDPDKFSLAMPRRGVPFLSPVIDPLKRLEGVEVNIKEDVTVNDIIKTVASALDMSESDIKEPFNG